MTMCDIAPVEYRVFVVRVGIDGRARRLAGSGKDGVSCYVGTKVSCNEVFLTCCHTLCHSRWFVRCNMSDEMETGHSRPLTCRMRWKRGTRGLFGTTSRGWSVAKQRYLIYFWHASKKCLMSLERCPHV